MNLLLALIPVHVTPERYTTTGQNALQLKQGVLLTSPEPLRSLLRFIEKRRCLEG